MKVLLAPLYFMQRACKHCARIFYRERPGSWMGLLEFESMPPLGAFDTARGFIPDFPALLMFEEFVMDEEAYDRLKKPGNRTWLREWTNLVSVFKSEGALTLTNVPRAGATNPNKRAWQLRHDLRSPQDWWEAMGYFDNLAGNAERLLGEHPEKAKSFSWRFNPDRQPGVKGSDGHYHDLSAILLEAGRSSSKAHKKLYEQALANLKTHLREVNACMTACTELKVAPMMWAPYRRYLQQKLTPRSQQAVHAAEAGRTFFNISFPAYMPTTVRQFSRLRSDRRINSLRTEIMRAVRNGEPPEPDYAQRVLMEVLKVEQRTAQVRSIIGWMANIAGMIPVPGLGAAATLISESTSELISRRKKAPWHWFYLISDGRGAT